jgi:hypothetical protein
MECFSKERVVEFDQGAQPTDDELRHTELCDDCCEIVLLHVSSTPATPPELVWDEGMGCWMPNIVR